MTHHLDFLNPHEREETVEPISFCNECSKMAYYYKGIFKKRNNFTFYEEKLYCKECLTNIYDEEGNGLTFEKYLEINNIKEI